MDHTPLFEQTEGVSQMSTRKKIVIIAASTLVFLWFVFTTVAMSNSKHMLSLIHKDIHNHIQGDDEIHQLVVSSNVTMSYIQSLVLENNATLSEMRTILSYVNDTNNRLMSIYNFIIAVCNMYPEYKPFCPK